MKLKKLSLINFQGMRTFSLDTDGGQDVSVFADNAIGKTTIYNAFLWLLFEKNSLGAKDFEIKTRDENELTLFKLQRLNAIRASVSRYARQTGKKFKVEFKYPHTAVIITRTV